MVLNNDFSGKSNGYNIHLNITSLFFNISLATVFLLDIQGHEKEALQLMATYLPKDTSPGSAYQEGGGLYALGLIHANHGGDIIDYLLNQLKNASNDVCTGLSNEPLFFFGICRRVLAGVAGGVEVLSSSVVLRSPLCLKDL